VTISSDLSLHKHVSNVYAKCFFLTSQKLRRVRLRRSLDVEYVKTLVHAFVTTRLDYCNSVLAGAPRSVTDKLQRVLNAAARLASSQWYPQIRSWSVTSAARRLAGRSELVQYLVASPSLSLDQRLHCRPTSVIRRVVTSLSDVH